MSRVHLSLLTVLLVTSVTRAADWYAAPDGGKDAAGTRESPWDIASALAGQQKRLAPGDTLRLLAGVYKSPDRRPVAKGFPVRLAGTADRPIVVRPADRSARVTIDGGLLVQAPAAFLHIRDLELTVSEPVPAEPVEETGNYSETNRPWGGLEVLSADHCTFINLVIHGNSQGVGLWKEAKDCELYGCIIYDNGWPGERRGHGHAVYTQNDAGTKTIRHNIMTGGFAYTLHAYGSDRAFVNNYLVAENIVYNANGPFLIGGGRPSNGIRVLKNYLYNASMQLGYTKDPNGDLELRDNLVVNGGINKKTWTELTDENNVVLVPKAPRPGGVKSVLLPNEHDPGRAHLAVFDLRPNRPATATHADIDPGPFLAEGQTYRLFDPRNLYGPPVYSAKRSGPTIQIPLTGEFAAYVLIKGD